MQRPYNISGPVVILAAAASSVCSGQPPAKVDPGTSDVSPNAASLRRMEVDLRRPTGFDGVYQLSKVDAFGRGQNMFMRIDGGVTAIFPRSVYVPTAAGLVPQIPPGTVFQIGPLPQPAAASGHISQNHMDTRLRVPEGTDEPPVIRDVPVSRSLISNEVYRRRRLESLLTPDAV